LIQGEGPLLSSWRLLITGFILGSVITAGIFITPSIVLNKTWTWKWASWVGIGEDKITKRTVERLGGENGSIQKVTFTDEPQPAKTLWDFLELSGSLAVPFLLLYLGHQIQKRDKEISEINLREEALQSYLDRISEILIDGKINSLDPNDSSLELIKDIVRTRTLTLLRSLDGDGERKGAVMRFLVDADLINSYLTLDLSSASLQGAKLSSVNLSRAYLSNADLSNADLSNADLSNADLSNADLSNADLTSTQMYSSTLNGANLTDSELTSAKLNGADFKGAKLSGVTGLEQDQVRSAVNLTFTP
jgi:uncharacterized protein YjbI with pentapeptide repeats